MTVIDNRFKSTKPVFCAQGRYDDVIICQGDTVKPSRWVSGSEAPCTDAGIIAPAEKPVITLDATPSYYVARTDIKKPGAIYYSAPAVTYSAGGSPPAQSTAFLEQSAVSEIRQDEGGKYYSKPPSATLSETFCKAKLSALLKLPPTFTVDSNLNSQVTGLTSGSLISAGPPWPDEGNIATDSSYTNYDWWPYIDMLVQGNGIKTAPRIACRYWRCPGAESNPGTVCSGPMEYEITGFSAGAIIPASVQGASDPLTQRLGFTVSPWQIMTSSYLPCAQNTGFVLLNLLSITVIIA